MASHIKCVVPYSCPNLRLTHWGRVTHICVNELTIIGSDNGLLPDRRQAIVSNNAGFLLIGPLGTNFIEISIGIQTFSLKKCTWTCSLRNGVHFFLGLNVLNHFSNWGPWRNGPHFDIWPSGSIMYFLVVLLSQFIINLHFEIIFLKWRSLCHRPMS